METAVTRAPAPRTAPPAPPVADTAAATPPAARLAWLDALRGIAVLAVVYEHLGGWILRDTALATRQWVHAGTFGVMLFFLVSGYIIPASLERRGNLRDFWIGRLFRLYPAWLAAIAVAVGLAAVLDRIRVPDVVWDRPSTVLLGHLGMLQDAIGVSLLQHQFWTLTYEMFFYLLVTVLFVAGQHRRSAATAITLAAVVALAGGVLPARLLTDTAADTRNLTVLSLLALAAGLLGVTARRRGATLAGAAVLAALVLSLLLLNSRKAAWEGLLILAVMFLGTAIYRAEQRQIRWWSAAAAGAAVCVAAVFATYRYGGMWFMVNTDTFPVERSWLGALAAAGALFGLGMAIRHRRIPRWLSWLGAISYSVYLLHNVVIYLFGPLLRRYNGAARPMELLVVAGYLAALLLLSYLSYRLVERPGQQLGRRVAAALRARGSTQNATAEPPFVSHSDRARQREPRDGD